MLMAESEQGLTHEALEGVPILPSITDDRIKSFNSPHYCYVDRRIILRHEQQLPSDRHELLLWIPGTSQSGEKERKGGADSFCKIAAELGYHVVILKYPNDVSASICGIDSNPSAFEDFRMALIAGGTTDHINISRSDSIENRLIRLLLHLKQTRPREDWGQFLTPSQSIKWETIAVAGQSQGGGHAALIAIKHHVSRVICTGSPKDYSKALNKPAAWYLEESATPKACFFSFTHEQDFQGCTPEQQMENLHALKLDSLGAPANVDNEPYPYHNTRILRTNYPGGKLESEMAHTSVMSSKNKAVFEKVWTYMLTEKTP